MIVWTLVGDSSRDSWAMIRSAPVNDKLHVGDLYTERPGETFIYIGYDPRRAFWVRLCKNGRVE